MSKIPQAEFDVLLTKAKYNREGVTLRDDIGGTTGVIVYYDWHLAGAAGASFSLLREPHHTPADIAHARSALRNAHDVVSLHVLSPE